MQRTLKFIAASAAIAGLLLTATPALADSGHQGGNDGWHIGSFLNLPLAHIGVNAGSFKNSDEYKSSATSGTTTGFVKPFTLASSSVEIGTVGSVNGSSIVLDPAIDLNGTSTAAANVVINASTTFKGGATSTASLTSGENVIIVGTTSTSTSDTITASIVIALKSAWHFCTHLLSH